MNRSTETWKQQGTGRERVLLSSEYKLEHKQGGRECLEKSLKSWPAQIMRTLEEGVRSFILLGTGSQRRIFS